MMLSAQKSNFNRGRAAVCYAIDRALRRFENSNVMNPNHCWRRRSKQSTRLDLISASQRDQAEAIATVHAELILIHPFRVMLH
jgi:fido (protein-threonine AMPylation protein)